MLLENIQENNQYFFYSLQNDIDDIAKIIWINFLQF